MDDRHEQHDDTYEAVTVQTLPIIMVVRHCGARFENTMKMGKIKTKTATGNVWRSGSHAWR